MSKTNLRPTTLNGIKTLAHDLKVHAGMTHTAGLEMASGLAGFPNYKAALNHHSAQTPPNSPPRYTLYISAWWRDLKAKTSGRETVKITTAKPIDHFVPRSLMRHSRFLGGMDKPGPDHLVIDRISDSEYRARHDVAGAARSLTFMEATGLVPSKAWKKQFPGGDEDNALPGHDHYGVWYDQAAKQYVITDEPYMGRTEVDTYDPKRAAWARKYNIDLRPVQWKGMYYPDGGSRLYVFTDASTGYDLAGLVHRLDALPEPVSSEVWTGESAPFADDFVTPGTFAERTLKAAAKALKGSTPRKVGPRNSISSGGGRTRPAAKLDVAVHARMGELLKAALRNSDPRYRIHKQVNQIRSRIEDWMAAEYSRDELDGPAFFEVYYKELKDKSLIGARGEEDAAANRQLTEVKSILLGAYPDSAPLREMVGRIDRVRGYLGS